MYTFILFYFDDCLGFGDKLAFGIVCIDVSFANFLQLHGYNL